MNDYDLVGGLELLGIDTAVTKAEALKMFGTRLACLFTSLVLSIGQANYVHHTKLYNRLLADMQLADPQRPLMDAMNKLHKITDQRVLTGCSRMLFD